MNQRHESKRGIFIIEIIAMPWKRQSGALLSSWNLGGITIAPHCRWEIGCKAINQEFCFLEGESNDGWIRKDAAGTLGYRATCIHNGKMSFLLKESPLSQVFIIDSTTVTSHQKEACTYNGQGKRVTSSHHAIWTYLT